MDRRTLIRWVMAAAASAPAWQRVAWAGAASAPAAAGYGTDPVLTKTYRPGELWPLTFSPAQRTTAAALCALIIPADERSPSAADVGVHLFIDEWVSAPYPRHAQDRELILTGLAWLDETSGRRFGTPFASASAAQQTAICDDICFEAKAAPEHAGAAKFFARVRDLTADGFYTTPEGTKDLGYVGNVPLARFDGPPPEALRKAGVEDKP
jgi:Gluconate 2-dehydrogenase subunit 3